MGKIFMQFYKMKLIISFYCIHLIKFENKVP
jgi:hypothetical protein